MSNALLGFIAMLVGLFCAFCAYKDYDWFMNNRKARLFVTLFGRSGARFFYIIFGVIIVVLGIVVIFIPGSVS